MRSVTAISPIPLRAQRPPKHCEGGKQPNPQMSTTLCISLSSKVPVQVLCTHIRHWLLAENTNVVARIYQRI